jgi:hypothetical protein
MKGTIMDYKTWRKDLHNLQLRIDKLDDDYYEKEDFSDESKSAWIAARKILTDDLDAMYTYTPEQ